jgi:GntR family transcriptional regulator
MARTQPVLVQISTGDARPISRQIVDSIRMKIATAEIEPGARIPSVRGLAQQLTVNPNTVAKAYAELAADGWLEARPGLGLFVTVPRQRLSKPERERRLAAAVDRFVSELVALSVPLQEAQLRLEEQMSSVLPRKVA